MKTLEQYQAAVNEIKEVCAKHGIVLVGNCYSEGILGEIALDEAGVAWQLDEPSNVVVHDYKGFSVSGIGEIQEK